MGVCVGSGRRSGAVEARRYSASAVFRTYSADDYWFSLGPSFVVSDSDSKIVGFLVAAIRRNKIGHIITIDVLSEARRTGAGSMLLTAAEEHLRQRNCQTIYLETAVDNRSALTFYKKHKYFTVKTVPHFYSNGVDALVLQKDLLSTAQAS